MRFTILRLFNATVAFAIPYSLLREFGLPGIIVAAIIGISTGGICLLVKREDIWPMTRTSLLTFGGLILGSQTNSIVAASFGLIVGFIFGICITHSERNRKARELHEASLTPAQESEKQNS